MIALKIAIIAGHSSTTAGKRTPPFFNPIDIDDDGSYDIQVGEQYREHYANVGVSLKFDEALRRCGFETVKIGWDDADATNDTLNDDSVGLAKRQSLVKANNCDYSVSIHFNACGDGATFNTATGICTYYHNVSSRAGDSALLASFIQGQIINGAKQYNRGIYSAGFAEVNCQAMGVKAAVLVELAFMTNQVEAETMMANEQYWIESAEEICRAFCRYVGAKYVEREDEDEMIDFKNLTDEQTVALLDRIAQYLAKEPTSKYAVEASEKGVKSKLFSDGDGDKLLDNPRGFLRREELAVVLDRKGLLDG